MSYSDGWSALNLEMPPRVPHTEYSIEGHWEVVEALTGQTVTPQSPPETRAQASLDLMRVCNFDLRWSTLLHTQPFGELRTRMGHAEYAAGATDWDTQISCPFKTPEEVLAFDFTTAYGVPDRAAWRRAFEAHYQQNCRELPDLVNMTGIYGTLVSGMLEVFGWEMLLLAAGTDPLAFGALTDRYAQWILPYFEALAEANVPAVMIHDDIVWSSGPIFRPAWYRQYIFPNYQRMFAPLRQTNKKILYTSDGCFTPFIDDIVACGVNAFVMEPTTDMAYIAEKYGRTHAFIGNADTRVLLFGSREDIRAEVARCMQIGKACPGFFLAVGNHIPSNTPRDAVLYYLEVYEEMSRR